MKSLFVCLFRGHRWDTSPWRSSGEIRCVRCGLSAEPVPHLH